MVAYPSFLLQCRCEPAFPRQERRRPGRASFTGLRCRPPEHRDNEGVPSFFGVTPSPPAGVREGSPLALLMCRPRPKVASSREASGRRDGVRAWPAPGKEFFGERERITAGGS